MSEIKSPKQIEEEMEADGYRQVDYIINDWDETIDLVFLSNDDRVIITIKIDMYTFEATKETRTVED